MLDANVAEECPPVVALDNHQLLVVAERSCCMQELELVFVVQGWEAYSRGACFVFVVACGFVVGGVVG